MSLRQSDLLGVLGFLREAEALAGAEPFPPQLLERLQILIPSDGCGFCELDRIRKRLICQVDSSGERLVDDPADEAQEVYWRLRHQHPTCAYQDRTGDFGARKISDFLSRREFHRLELYADCYGQFGIEYWLNAGLPAPLSHTKVFIFVRRQRDFSERDRDVLELLRPHLAHLYEAAEARALAAALAAGVEAPGELVVLDRADRIVHASERAHRLLNNYTGSRHTGRLPGTLEDWLWQERRRLNGDILPPRAQPFTIERGRHRLVVTRVNGDRALHLSEEALTPPAHSALSTREQQVLALVAEGKANSEIADELWITLGTVRSHLEHVYTKLGVHNRTAAVAQVGMTTPKRDAG